jgi:ABC-type polar amino acid transport system ATPase subunit
MTEYMRDFGLLGDRSAIFQHDNLFPHRRVLENVIECPVQVQRRPRSLGGGRGHAAAGSRQQISDGPSLLRAEASSLPPALSGPRRCSNLRRPSLRHR